MSVPSFQQLMLPALQTIGQRYDEISIAGLEEEVGKALRISPEERQVMLPSGNQTLFGNRLNWARSYLSKAGLIELPRRGYCRATDRGRKLLAEGLCEIDLGLWSANQSSSPGEAKARSRRLWTMPTCGITPRL
jgi:restriction system protein